MAGITIRSYGEYSSSNYGAHALYVEVGRLELWFSYQTVVAFRATGQLRVVRENSWGPTTGKHLNAIDGGNKSSRLSSDEFERRLSETLAALGLTEDAVSVR